MNNLFEERRTLLILLLSVFFLLLLTLYLFYLQPKADELKSTKSTNETLESDIAVMKAQNNKDVSPQIAEIKQLEKKVPTDPRLEEFILDIQEMEQVTNSKIDVVNFAYDGELPQVTPDEDTTSTPGEDNAESADEAGTTEEAGDQPETPAANEAEEQPQAAPAGDAVLPAGTHLITATLTVFSPDYNHFLQFIQEVENQERIMTVDSLTFVSPTEEEIMNSTDADETINFTVTVTTFYYE